jgi:regulator of protease activity HflC (stomatin/prohibitin superfamily)
MEVINSIAAFISKLFQWWFTIMPWEQAIHIRKGDIVKLRGAGLYFKIPFIDSVYIQTTRMRMVDTPMQTMSTKEGLTVTIKSVLGYTIADIRVLYDSLYHPEMTLNSMVMSYISEYVRANNVSDISPFSIEEALSGKIDGLKDGLKDVTVKITTFAVVKTYRLIQDGCSLYENSNMQPTK